MIKNVNVLFWVILFTTENWEQWLGVQIQQRAGAKTQSLHLFKVLNHLKYFWKDI